MREALVKEWLRAHPTLKEFDPKRAPDSPNPLVLLELIPDSFGKQVLEKPLEKPFEIKPLKITNLYTELLNQPSTLYEHESEHEIRVTNHAYHNFLNALGLYAWKNLLTLGDRKNYVSLISTPDSPTNTNYLFVKEKKGVSPANSTWLHFARNVQNVIIMRPLEFVKHRKGATEALLAFFEETGVIDARHRELYLKYLTEQFGTKRALEAKSPIEVNAWIEHGRARRSEALDVLHFIKTGKIPVKKTKTD